MHDITFTYIKLHLLFVSPLYDFIRIFLRIIAND